MSATCQGCGAPIPPSRGGPPRKWCSARCRKASYGDPCVDCGTRTGFGAECARIPEPRCLRCARIHSVAPQRALIERLWAEGKTADEIAHVVGWDVADPCAYIAVLRHRGYDLPVRNAASSKWHKAHPEHMAKARDVARRNREGAAL